MRTLDAARLVRTIRQRADLSQRALARRAGTAQSVVARIELGETSPTVNTLHRLLEAAGLELRVGLRPRLRDRPPTASEVGPRVREALRGIGLPGIVSVYLFGSVVRGRAHSGSDVDVGVLLDRSTWPRKIERSELRIDLSSELIATLGWNAVDVVILNDVPPGFGRRIVVEGTRIVCHDPELDHAFFRDVQLRWGDLEPFLRRVAALKIGAVAR
jgi:predicted nucleotidyltransferase/DNA-binding XRE family transcriptional regulator